jgi:hypothetical protein
VSGDRSASITVSGNIVWDAGTYSNLVDGGIGDNGTDSVDVPLAFASGDYIDFEHATNKLINSITFKVGGVFDFGDFQVRLGGELSNVIGVSGNTSAAFAITGLTLGGTNVRLVKVGISTPSNVWLREIEFQECTC